MGPSEDEPYTHMSKAIDDVRATEVKDLRARGKKPVLTRTRWLFLKRPENLTPGQQLGHFRTQRALEVALYQALGRLLEPTFARRFC